MAKRRKSGGITTQEQGEKAPFNVSPENWVHGAILNRVYVETKEDDDGGEDKVFLCFEFCNSEKTRWFTHKERTIDTDDDADYKKWEEWQNQRIAHIFNAGTNPNKHLDIGGRALGALPEGVEDEETWEQFFGQIAEDFNTARKGKPVYQDKNGKSVPFWIKITINKNGYQQFGFPNFIEKMTPGKETNLYKKKKEIFTVPAKSNPMAGSQNTNPGNGGGGFASKKMPSGF